MNSILDKHTNIKDEKYPAETGPEPNNPNCQHIETKHTRKQQQQHKHYDMPTNLKKYPTYVCMLLQKS